MAVTFCKYYKISSATFLLLLSLIPIQAITGATNGAVAQDDNKKIGVIFPLTGALAPIAEKVRQGITLATETESFPLSHFIFEDGELSNTKVLSAFQKLLTVDKIDALIGPFGPGQTTALFNQATRKSVPVVAVALCDKRFIAMKGAFCTYLSPREQALPVLKRFNEPDIAPSAKRVGIMIEEVDGFQEFRTLAEEFARQPGRTLVSSEAFAGETTDFRSSLLKLKSQNVTLFMFGAVDPQRVAIMLRQAKEIDFLPKIRWVFAELDQNVFKSNADLFHDAWFLNQGIIDNQFRQLFIKRYGKEPDLYSAIGFDATRSLITALRKVPFDRRSEIGNELYKQRLTGTAFRSFAFDRANGVVMDSQLTRLEHGEVLPVE